jgi:hypothetical protein
MSPLYLQNGKLLVKNGALATSVACCCAGPCDCPPAVCPTGGPYLEAQGDDGFTYWIELNSVNGAQIIWHNSDGQYSLCLPPPGGTIQCYDSSVLPNVPFGDVDVSGLSKYIVGQVPHVGDFLIEINTDCTIGTVHTYRNGSTFSASIVCISEPFPWPQGCTPTPFQTEWEVYDTTNSKVLQTGTVTVDTNAKTLTLNGLADPWKPLGYYSKNFDAILRFVGSNDNLDSWSVSIGSCETDRYPEHDFGEIKRNYCVESQDPYCNTTEEYTIVAGGAIESTRVTAFVGTVDTEYTNLFNWADGTYDNLLPDNTTNISVTANCLSTALSATCNNLSISGNILFGISITASGSVSVNGAHVIDEKYNSCNNRGVINCSSGGSVSTATLSDSVTYQYNGDVQFTNNARLSGTVNYTGSNNVAVTFNDCSITDSGTISGGQHIYVNNTDIEYLASPAGCNSVATPSYNGKWIMVGTTRNLGGTITTNQYVRFFGSSQNLRGGSANTDPGTITTTASVDFYDTSHNGVCTDAASLAVITNDAKFYNTAYNAGTVSGDADFYDTSYFNCGDIDGTINFWDNSHNDGTINSCDITFNDDSYNTGYLECNP